MLLVAMRDLINARSKPLKAGPCQNLSSEAGQTVDNSRQQEGQPSEALGFIPARVRTMFHVALPACTLLGTAPSMSLR